MLGLTSPASRSIASLSLESIQVYFTPQEIEKPPFEVLQTKRVPVSSPAIAQHMAQSFAFGIAVDTKVGIDRQHMV